MIVKRREFGVTLERLHKAKYIHVEEFKFFWVHKRILKIMGGIIGNDEEYSLIVKNPTQVLVAIATNEPITVICSSEEIDKIEIFVNCSKEEVTIIDL